MLAEATLLGELPTELGPLEPNEVHVWLVEPDAITDRALLAAYERLLTEDERRKRARFVFEAGRHECLVTRALVRTTLSRYAPIRPEGWRFGANQHGRPFIVAEQNPGGLEVNLSHTHGLIACAVTRGRDVGVDVENVIRAGDTVEIADRFFSPAEVRDLHALPVERRQDRFFDYWTLKESYIKARGMGLALPLDKFSFHLLDGPPIRISIDPSLNDDPASWRFHLMSPRPEHRLAVGVRAGRTGSVSLRLARTVPLA